MHKNTIAFILLNLILQSCQVYQSPERKDFESESPQFRVQSLQKIASCSNTSKSTIAQAGRVVYQNESERITEYIILNESIFESENLQGEYCVLSYSHE